MKNKPRTANTMTYLHNTCGIATFRAKPNENIISDLEMVGNLRSVDFLEVGKYRINLFDSMNQGELYQVVITLQPGFSTGLLHQSESYCDIGIKDFDDNFVDQGEPIYISFHRLTAPE